MGANKSFNAGQKWGRLFPCRYRVGSPIQGSTLFTARSCHALMRYEAEVFKYDYKKVQGGWLDALLVACSMVVYLSNCSVFLAFRFTLPH